MINKSLFLNKSLQEINVESDVIISNHLQDLHRISNDINALEKRLKEGGIPFTFIYILSSNSRRFERKISDCFYLSEVDEEIENCLVWGKTEDCKYRLRYNTYITETVYELATYTPSGEPVYGNGKIGEPRLITTKPLIETKSNFRLKIENELPVFYKMIIDALKTKRDQDLIVGYSPKCKQPHKDAKVYPERFSPF